MQKLPQTSDNTKATADELSNAMTLKSEIESGPKKIITPARNISKANIGVADIKTEGALRAPFSNALLFNFYLSYYVFGYKISESQ